MRRVLITICVLGIVIVTLIGDELISANQSTESPTAQLPETTKTQHPSPTITLTPTSAIPRPSETPNLITDPKYLYIFQDLWSTIDKEYLYPDFNGLNWDEIYASYHQELTDGVTGSEFYILMEEMVRELDDDHSYYLNPKQVTQQNKYYSGENTFSGIGVYLKPLPERQEALIILTYDDSPAANAGLQAYDRILKVNGESIVSKDGNLTGVFDNSNSSILELLVQSPGEPPRTVIVPKAELDSKVPIPNDVLLTPSNKRIGYFLLISFRDRSIPDQVNDILVEMTKQTSLDGLIIDNRLNQGGTLSVLKETLSFFVSGRVGFFTNRVRDYPFYIDQPKSIGGSQSLPLVILTGPDTMSYGEIFAGILQDADRAVLIGEPTKGNIETMWGYDFNDGSRAWIAHDTFIPSNDRNSDWENTGVIPDILVEINWEYIAGGNDDPIKAGVKYFDEYINVRD